MVRGWDSLEGMVEDTQRFWVRTLLYLLIWSLSFPPRKSTIFQDSQLLSFNCLLSPCVPACCRHIERSVLTFSLCNSLCVNIYVRSAYSGCLLSRTSVRAESLNGQDPPVASFPEFFSQWLLDWCVTSVWFESLLLFQILRHKAVWCHYWAWRWDKKEVLRRQCCLAQKVIWQDKNSGCKITAA